MPIPSSYSLGTSSLSCSPPLSSSTTSSQCAAGMLSHLPARPWVTADLGRRLRGLIAFMTSTTVKLCATLGPCRIGTTGWVRTSRGRSIWPSNERPSKRSNHRFATSLPRILHQVYHCAGNPTLIIALLFCFDRPRRAEARFLLFPKEEAPISFRIFTSELIKETLAVAVCVAHNEVREETDLTEVFSNVSRSAFSFLLSFCLFFVRTVLRSHSHSPRLISLLCLLNHTYRRSIN